MFSHEQVVLFVDDEKNILSTLRRLCRREAYTVLTAGSGAEALDLLAERPASVIISDYRMPEMTGVEMLARAKDIIPDSIRIILSGFADTQSVVEAINKGEVYRFLSKPWDDQELLTVIRQSLEHWELKRENAALDEQLTRQNEQLQRLNENLELIVTERTRSLAFAQDVLEHLPLGVLGVSREGEVMLTNSFLQQHWPCFGHVPPGEAVEAILPAEITTLIRQGLSQRSADLCCLLEGQPVHLTINRLGTEDHDRGFVLVLHPGEEVVS